MEEWIALAIIAVGSVGGTALGALLGLKGAGGGAWGGIPHGDWDRGMMLVLAAVF
jgi:hypothetical protein